MLLRDLVFFMTGAAALAYEVLWARLLARVLGGDAEGAALVLALFMLGLGLGAASFASRASASERPRALFAGLELFAGGWAAASPWMLAAIDPTAPLAVRVLLCALAILPPTLAMGATFPLMGRLSIVEPAEAGQATARFYGANTFGACLGALLAPTLLMPLFGLSRGLAAAACLDLAAALLALRLPAARPAAPREARPSLSLSPALAAVPFLIGFTSLALEVMLTRLLVSLTGATVYSFALVLAVFLLGIGLGSAQASGLRALGARPRRVLGACAAFAPPMLLLGLVLLGWKAGQGDLFGILANLRPPPGATWRMWAVQALLAALALLPVTIAFGLALPSAVAAALEQRRGDPPEGALGAVYLSNTLGALLGSLVAGFALLPLCGPRVGLALALLPCLLAAFLAAGPRALLPWAGAGAAFLLALHALGPPGARRGPTPLALYFGRNATVAVEESVEPDGARLRSLRVNGKVEASTAPVDMRLQRLLALIPAHGHGEVQSALVIGLGSGMTAGALLALPELELLRVFEIERSVPLAARSFAAWNGGLLDDPRLELSIADGRLALARSRERFDLITADPLHPATRGSSDLFALEHFQAMAAHLAPGGVASQWLPLYELSTADVRTVVATWTAAFEHCSAWLTAYDLALVGSREELPPERMEAALPSAVRRLLSEVGVHSSPELEALLVARDGDLREFARGVRPMTLDRPLLEARAPLSYLSGYATEVLAWAGRREFAESLPERARPRALAVRGLLARFLADLPRGWSAAASAYGHALLALPPLAERP